MFTLFYDDQDLEVRLLAAPASIFLAGPTARGVRRTPWRAEALELLSRRGYSGAAVLPELRDGLFTESAPRAFGYGHSAVPHLKTMSYNILRWETTGIEQSTLVLFWMPFTIGAEEDPTSLPGFTTRAEVSRELQRAPSRVILGMPPGGFSTGHIRYHAHLAGVPIYDSLETTVDAALLRLAVDVT